MKFWNRRNKIEFFHIESSVVENFPIIESKNLKLKWAAKARQDFQKLVKEGVDNTPGFSHLSRCPGIFDLFKYGYVVSLHKDIIIRPKGKGFDWELKGYTRPPEDSWIIDFEISGQGQTDVDLISTPPWASDFIVKIVTGWHIIAPKGLKFILLPIAYPDTFDFTSTIGILNPAITTELNFQMFWNGNKDKTLIRAGTPLGHIIPLSEKKYQMVQRVMNQRDRDWVAKIMGTWSSSFWRYTTRKRIVDMYNKYWK